MLTVVIDDQLPGNPVAERRSRSPYNLQFDEVMFSTDLSQEPGGKN